MEGRTKTGLMLCEEYFEKYGRPCLEKKFPDILDHISCGLVGEGSECLGFDDALSKDHDFGPAFCIWVENEWFDKKGEELTKAYNGLPYEYNGIKRYTTSNARGRVGVMRYSDFLMRTIGREELPKTPEEWNAIPDEKLGLIVNGKIFMDKSGRAEIIRKKVLYERPFADRAAKLATQLELMAKCGQYNYYRAESRGDEVAEMIAVTGFIESSMRAWHLLQDKFAPYDKWLYRSLIELPGGEELGSLLRELTVDRERGEHITEVCELVRKECLRKGFCYREEQYLADMAAQAEEYARRAILGDRITELEFRLFDKTDSMGGRASCQDDWGTFSKMRRSQYYSFPMVLLQSILYDFTKAEAEGRNVISEKYGFMMESTAPSEFEQIKDALPKLDDRFVQVREAIVGIQVKMMEDFSAEYPRIAGNARAIHTSEDNPFFTSYETYLRGELSTYSMDSLVLYGKMIADLAGTSQNLAKIIMTKSVHMYGYNTLDEAEKKN